jgi:hypothetical protein
MTTDPFVDLAVLGALPPDQAMIKLREVGEDMAAARIEERTRNRAPESFRGGFTDWWPFRDRAWQHTAHAFGFLAIDRVGAALRPIQAIGMVQADPTLRGGRVKIALSQLRVADYPGGGTHRVLFDFYARNQVPSGAEELHFNATYRVREGERTAVAGYPIFIGLNVGSEGMAFRCHTVNVKNDADEAFLDMLEGDVFKAGLKLVTTAQPAIAPLADMALGLTKSVAKRNRNVSVQDFYLGLDFAGTSMGGRLAQGDYSAVQLPESLRRVWRWDDWVFDPDSGLIVDRADNDKLIPYNYVVFGVSRYDGD